MRNTPPTTSRQPRPTALGGGAQTGADGRTLPDSPDTSATDMNGNALGGAPQIDAGNTPGGDGSGPNVGLVRAAVVCVLFLLLC